MKYQYHKIIQQNYGQGWEDVESYDTDSTGSMRVRSDFAECKRVCKEYRLMGYPTRTINRREKI
jgi:hypothetical protein